MSRLMRRGRRAIPSPLDIGRAPAPKVESLSPRRLNSPRQFVTLVPSQATALPTPIQSILTTTVFHTVTPTALPTTPSISTAPVQTQIPTATNGSSIMPIPTLQADETTGGGGGGNAPTTVVDVAQGSNMTVIAGVAGAAGFSFLTIALFFYVRSKTASNARENE
ncbi:hypothetical protein N0V93_002619 [Gnomoniopsis smithogilvyi]|uniref:Uncharacterized protein n=1 Tax=Gnomoniopsis smithogilvyi TaxID=1191159 RepID=A0A9W8YV46_9PEZI|nr:hypothetical protein N0V93_002619 [Gnomoniopsis smithogilvyi]